MELVNISRQTGHVYDVVSTALQIKGRCCTGHSPTVSSPRDKPATNAVTTSRTSPEHHGVTTTLQVANSNDVAMAMSMLTIHQPIKMAANMAPKNIPLPPAM